MLQTSYQSSISNLNNDRLLYLNKSTVVLLIGKTSEKSILNHGAGHDFGSLIFNLKLPYSITDNILN
jgi:hypothetical protein